MTDEDVRVVTVSYARTHLHALIRDVQAGHLVQIRRRDGRTVTLQPYVPSSAHAFWLGWPGSLVAADGRRGPLRRSVPAAELVLSIREMALVRW